MNTSFNVKSIFLFLIIGIFLTGCWPSKFTKKVKAVPEQIQNSIKKIEKLESDYKSFSNSEKFNKISLYAERENWKKYFLEARNELNHAQQIYDDDILPLLKKKSKDSIPIVKTHLDRINSSKTSAYLLAEKPIKRAELILEAIKNKSEWEKKSLDEFESCQSNQNDFTNYATQTQSEYTNKKDDISQKVSSLNSILSAISVAYLIVKTEANSSNPDYAKLTDNRLIVSQKVKEHKETEKFLRNKLSELYRSYTKTLIDMKVVQKPWVQMVTYRWSNYSDYDNTRKIKDEKVAISMDEFKQVEAEFQRNPNGFVIKRGSETEVWIENLDYDEEFYHKYAITENGNREETSWIKVFDDFYEEHEDDLGMDILSKPYGYYEEESLTEAVPEGMSLIGNERYGRWERDNSGNRFWGWYGRYAFYSSLFGGRRYYYNDWNTWNRSYRGRRAYYGMNDNVYGTYGRNVQSNSRYQKSNFGRKGNFKSQSASVRGAGSSSRGRGPGGGGK